MSVGGVAIAIAVVLILTVLPHLIERRWAVMESREGDRFSPRLQLVQVKPRRPQAVHVGSCRLLAPQPTLDRSHPTQGQLIGGNMSASPRRPVQGTGMRQRAHELAVLRARRAARRSAEAAAGQRRMAASGVFAALTVVAMIAAIASDSVSWWWVLAPLAGLAGMLGLSRAAAIRAERADEADRARISQLSTASQSVASSRSPRSEATRGQSRTQGVDRSATSATTDTTNTDIVGTDLANTSVVTTDATDAGATDPRVAEAVVAEADVTEADVAASMTNTEGAASAAAQTDVPSSADVAANTGTLTDEGSSREAHSAPARAWTPAPLPASRYSQGARVNGRVVHADTDLRGIPRVPASIPARPIDITVDPQARTTDEVAASIPLAFDLDEILDARRA